MYTAYIYCDITGEQRIVEYNTIDEAISCNYIQFLCSSTQVFEVEEDEEITKVKE